MLCALLADAYADRLFAADPEADDILVFREQLAARSPALQHVFDVAAGRVQLVTEAVPIPIADYHKLPIEDFMVSLYNDHSVQRVRIALPDGTRLPAHDVLAEAIAFLKR